MRATEILLKAAYLAASLWLFIMGVSHEAIDAFLIVSVLLGVTLIVNTKHPSYKYPAKYRYNGRVLIMRSIEGALILAFAAVLAYVAFA